MEVTGKIIFIGDTKTFGKSGFKKREFVIETDEQYPQKILLEFVQDKCALLDKFGVGKGVKVGINLRGREWANPEGEIKYFNSIQGWRIDAFVTEGVEMASPDKVPTFAEQEDDLPF